MEHNGAEIDVSYLARLLLQYENSPFMLERNLVRCQASLPLVCCADLSTLCVAWGRRIVVLPTHAHTHPLFFAAAVTPSTGEMVTSMCCVRVPGGKDVMILVGTSDGYLQIHHPSGDVRHDEQKIECIHRQRVHRRALSHMSLCCNSSILCMSAIDGIVLVDIMEILSLRQWWLKTGRETIELDARAYEMYTVGPRQETIIFSSRDVIEESLYDTLTKVNKRGHWSTASAIEEGIADGNSRMASSGPGPNAVAAMSIGRDPPITWFLLDRSTPSKGIISSLMDITSKMLFGRAAGEESSGTGTRTNARASRANSGTHVVDRPDESIDGYEMQLSTKEKRKLKGELVSPVASVWDEEKRDCFGLVCWQDEWAACCDCLGRVMIVDMAQKSITKIIKGYRDCYLSWIVRDGVPLLMIYAPKRRSLELWDVCGGSCEPRGRLEATSTGILIPSGAGNSFLFDYGAMCIRQV